MRWDSLGKIDRKDSNNQPWKKLSIEQMKELVGDIPDKYLLINPVYKLENINTGIKRRVAVDYMLEMRNVNGASLYKWGYDESISAW